MLTCKNKMFSKFLFFSLTFLFVSLIISSVAALSTAPAEKKEPLLRKKAAKIQIQQREILDHLERIEKRMITSEKRR